MTSENEKTQLNLDESAKQQIRDAQLRRKRINRVVGTARFNGWSEGIFASLSVIIALIDPTFISVFAAAALIIIAYTEFHGRAVVKSLDPKGMTILACNQLVFGSLIIVYAISQLILNSQGNNPHLAELASISELGEQIAELEQIIVQMVYWSLIVGTILFQGGMALFFFRSKKHLKTYIQDTPQWVIDVLKATE
ncbi:MAG TPA: hypothetical protein DCM28_07715 [Phycisphaerales bacterium]|nr:hypothetical protein [Phycisphaerales bacterium]HCD33277.1 hypothetical protein [Phycisphaerales bacterium]|tara:strand:+ start:881 stop:1465 length:585 start_codon:yes stop_codon:yes gene_type:complete